MNFYEMTKIGHWQRVEEMELRRAFETSRKRNTVSQLDKRRIRPNRQYDLAAVNPHARQLWGEAICGEISNIHCDGGDGASHHGKIHFVTLLDVSCARDPKIRLQDAEIKRIKNRLRHGIRGLSYFGMVEPGLYVNLQPGVRFQGKRCMFWHLHAVVWNVSRDQLKKRLRKLVKLGWYTAIADGLRPTHVRTLRQGRLPAHLGYILKSPYCEYRVSVTDRTCNGHPIIDSDGVVLRKFKQGKSSLRPGSRITLFHAMKHLQLDQLAVAGSDGTVILRNAKKRTMIPDAKGHAGQCRCFRARNKNRRNKTGRGFSEPAFNKRQSNNLG